MAYIQTIWLLCATLLAVHKLQSVGLVEGIDLTGFTLALSGEEGGMHRSNFYVWERELKLYCTLIGSGNIQNIMDRYNKENVTCIHPVLTIYNQSWSSDIQFECSDGESWSVSLTSRDLWVDDSVWLPREQWLLQAKLTDNDTQRTILSKRASLLHAANEPLLQWTLGDSKDGFDELEATSELLLRQSPCSPNVAILVPTMQKKSSIIVGVTWSALEKKISWYNLKSTLCAVEHDCGEVLDITYTSHHLLILTSKALHVSADLRYFVTSDMILKYTTTPIIDLTDCSSVARGHFNYVRICQNWHHDIFRNETVTLVLDCQGNHAWYASDPFREWQSVNQTHIVDVIYNYHAHSMAILYNTSSMTTTLDVRILTEKNNYLDTEPFFPVQTFSGCLSRLTFDPVTHILYMVGEEIWECIDGGNLCEVVYKMTNEYMISKLYFGKSDNTIIGTSSAGTLLYSKAGIGRFVELGTTVDILRDSVLIDILGFINIVSLKTNKITKIVLDINTELKGVSVSIAQSLVLQQLAGKEAVMMEYTAYGSPTFTKRNRGQVIRSNFGGSALILDVSQKTQYPSNFGVKVKLALLEPFHPFSSSDSSATLYTLMVYEIQKYTGEASLVLHNVPDGETGWQETDVNKTVLVPGSSSFLLTSYINDTHIEAASTGYAICPLVRSSRQWFIFNMHEGMELTEGSCRHRVVVDPSLGNKRMFTLDVGDQRSFYLLSNTTEEIPQQRTYIMYTTLSSLGPLKFITTSEFSYIPFFQNLSISLQSYLLTKGIVAIRTHVPTASLQCTDISPVLTFFSGCPCTKRLTYYYPVNITKDEFLYGNPKKNGTMLLKTLPTNYRPPSKLGIGIPISENTYNGDPSKPFPRDTFRISRETQRFGQCAGKDDRQACGCTEEMKHSADAKFSDCREKVYRLQERSIVRPQFAIIEEGRDAMPLTVHHIITLHEVNSRDPPVEAKRTSVTLDAIMNDPFLAGTDIFLDATSIEISLNGSELYHYRAELLTGSSHCYLYVEFQLYVDNAPIAYPLEYILKFSMAVVIGLVLFVVYLWYLSKHHTNRRRHIGPLCPDNHTAMAQGGSFPPSLYNIH